MLVYRTRIYNRQVIATPGTKLRADVRPDQGGGAPNENSTSLIMPGTYDGFGKNKTGRSTFGHTYIHTYIHSRGRENLFQNSSEGVCYYFVVLRVNYTV